MHVLDDDDIMNNLFASSSHPSVEKLYSFGSRLLEVT